jgi:hypothetical protein
MKVVDQRKNLFWRGLDRGDTPDGERIRLARGEDQDDRIATARTMAMMAMISNMGRSWSVRYQ